MSLFRTITVGFFLALAGLAGAAHAQTDHAAESSSSALQNLQDREAIRSLLINYGRYFDARDFAAYSNLFVQDAVWVGSGSDAEFVGPSAIREMVEQGFPPTVFPGSFHMMTSISVELTGDNSANAWSRWTFVTRDEDGNPTPFRAGHYEDILVREGGQWKFQKRQVFAD